MTEETAADSVLRAPRGEPERERHGRPATGTGGSSLEREAAASLAAELEATGREVQVMDLKVPAGQAPVVALHAALAIAGSLLGLLSPVAGAAVVLLVAFSFYGERGLGLFLLSRALPRRRTCNVISPPLGGVWEREVDTVLAAGYDAPARYPAGERLERLAGGRLTTDRILFWGGMVPTFAALMLRVATFTGLGTQLLQIVTTAILLGVLAAQADRRLQGETLGVEEDLTPARNLIAAVEELDREEDRDGGVAVCLFGAEADGAAGADGFYADRRLKVKPTVTVIGMVAAPEGARPEATAREGDLTTTGMDRSLVEDSPLKPQAVTIRRDTAAGRASRRRVRAITVVGEGETGLDLLFDAIGKSEAGREED